MRRWQTCSVTRVRLCNQTISEHDKKGVFVEGLTEASVQSAEETYELFQRGSHNRRVGITEMNRESSRSHAVFTVNLESCRRAFAGAALQKLDLHFFIS